MFETVFICEKSGELKPDLTTIARFAIQLSYPMSNLQHFLQARAGGLLVLIKRMGVDIQRGGGLAVTEDARHRGHIRAPAIIRLAAVCRREWTFSSRGKTFFLRISLKR